jgi:Ca2+/Na+ antiporter
MDKLDERAKNKRKEVRHSLMEKRSTIGAVTKEEQAILDDADLDEDAYYYKDENDHLVDIKIENEQDSNENGDKFSRILGINNDDDELEEDYVDDEEDEHQNPSTGLQVDALAPEVTTPNVPNIMALKTTVESVKSSDTITTKNAHLEALSDKIEKTRIEESKNLSSFLIDDHYEEEELTRKSNKETIIKKSKTRIRASKTKHKIVWSMLKMKKFLKKGVEGEESFSEMNIFNKLIFIFIDAPFDLLRRLTIPPADNEMWNRRIAAAVPICSVFFVFAVTGFLDFKSAPPIAFYVAEGVALLFSLLICFLTPLNSGPKKAMIIFSLFAFILSIVWIWFIANILIDLLGVIGLVLGFKPAFLGITLLAWGNSVGDMMANSAVAKKGFARMALTGCFAGPLFNLLIGLGMSLTIKKISGQPPEVFEIKDKEAILPMMAIGGLLFQLIMVIFISVLSKFHLRKIQGIIQIVYFLFILIAISIAAFTFAK